MLFKKRIDVEDYCSVTLKALFSPERESVFEQLRQRCADPALTAVDRKLYLDHIRAVVLQLQSVAIVKTYGSDVAFNAGLFVGRYLRDHGLSDVDSHRRVFNEAFANYPEGVSGMAWVFSKELSGGNMHEETMKRLYGEFCAILKCFFDEFKSIKLTTKPNAIKRLFDSRSPPPA